MARNNAKAANHSCRIFAHETLFRLLRAPVCRDNCSCPDAPRPARCRGERPARAEAHAGLPTTSGKDHTLQRWQRLQVPQYALVVLAPARTGADGQCLARTWRGFAAT